MCRFVVLLAVVFISAEPNCLAQDVSPLRTWQDASGSYSVQARLIKQNGDKVLLEKSDGSRVEVPLARLSKLDQDFVAKQNAGGPSSGSFDTTAAERASVLVWRTDNGRSIPEPAFVYSKYGDEAVVLSSILPTGLGSSSAQEPCKVAIYQDGKKSKELTGTKSVFGQTVFVPSKEFNSSLSEMKLANPTLRDPVKIIGFKVKPAVERVQQNAKVRKIFRDQVGVIRKIELTTDASNTPKQAVVVDSAGHLVGITISHDKGFAEVVPPSYFPRALSPRLSAVEVRLLHEDEESQTLAIRGRFSESLPPAMRDIMIHRPGVRKAPSGKLYAPNGTRANAKFNSDEPLPTFTANIKIPKSTLVNREVVLQMVTKLSDGQLQYSQPYFASYPEFSTDRPSESSLRVNGSAVPTGTSLVRLSPEMKKSQAEGRRWVATQAPKPTVSGREVATPQYSLNGLQARTIQLDANASAPVWAADGKAFFVLSSSGRVSRISFPDFVETHTLETNATCKSICTTKSRVVVSLTDPGALLVLSPKDLAVTEESETSNLLMSRGVVHRNMSMRPQRARSM